MLTIKDLQTNNSTDLLPGTLFSIQGGTWDDYWKLAHEDLKVEYIEEVIYIHSPANLDHEMIFGKLLNLITNHIEAHSETMGLILGSRFPIKLLDGKRVEPDLVYLSKQDITEGNLTKTVFEGIPSLIIEIVSPNYRNHDTVTKLEKYLELGVNEYWIVDPELKEIRIIKVENNSISKNQLITEGVFHSGINDLSEIEFSADVLWDLLV